MTKGKTRKVKKAGIKTSVSGKFARAVQGQETNTEKALAVLTSIRLKEVERDLILNPPIHESVAGSAR